MITVLVAGTRHKAHINCLPGTTLANAKVNLTVDLLTDYLQFYNSSVDCIVITDGGLVNDPYDSMRMIGEVTEKTTEENICLVVVTHDYYLADLLAQLNSVHVVYAAFPRITEMDFTEALAFSPKYIPRDGREKSAFHNDQEIGVEQNSGAAQNRQESMDRQMTRSDGRAVEDGQAIRNERTIQDEQAIRGLENGMVNAISPDRVNGQDSVLSLYNIFAPETREADIRGEPKTESDPVGSFDGFWQSEHRAKERVAEKQEEKTKGKRLPFGIGGRKGKPEPEADSFSGLSRIQNKAIAFTGRAGSGVTSTVANIAYAAARKGMRSLILDLDIDYRGANLYFNKFCTLAEEAEEVCRSLVIMLANPNNYMSAAVPINDQLWVAGLGYDFNDKQSLDSLYTEQKIAAMVSALKNKFDYVFVDFPLTALSRFPGVIMHFDVFALCVENNLHSAVTTLRALMNGFSPENIQYINMKSKLTATKYNSESLYDNEIITPERLAELITSGICDDFVSELPVAGAIPYIMDFDRQIESDVPIYETNTLLTKSYGEILSRL